jgi:hypothetical protein
MARCSQLGSRWLRELHGPGCHHVSLQRADA